MKLNNWSIVSSYGLCIEPRWKESYIKGIVEGNLRFSKGERCTFSINRVVYNIIKVSSGECYELGEMEDNYQKLFPDARIELFELGTYKDFGLSEV